MTINMTINNPGVQISAEPPTAEYLLAASLFQATSLLTTTHGRSVDLQERNDNQSTALEAAGEQLRTTFDDHAKTLQRNREYIEDNDALKVIVREQAEELARLAGELESTRNALDARGKTIDRLKAGVAPKIGDTVKVVGQVPRHAYGAGLTAKVESIHLEGESPYPEHDVALLDVSPGQYVAFESLEVIS